MRITALFAWAAILALGADDPIRLIAHRGGIVSEQFAENSPASLEEAARRGYWMIEVDVRESKDGVLVVQHDPDFERFYGVRRNVADMRWDEIVKLRAQPGNTRPMTYREMCEKASKAKLRLMVDTKEPSHPENFYREMESAMRDNRLLDTAYLIGTDESKRWFRGKARVSATYAELRTQDSAGEAVGKLHFLFEWGTMSREAVNWAFSKSVPVVPSINTFHYNGDNPMDKGTADLLRLKSWGVREFQIDSVYDQAFAVK